MSATGPLTPLRRAACERCSRRASTRSATSPLRCSSAAAIFGRTFDAGDLRAVSGRSDEEVAAALEELSTRGRSSSMSAATSSSHDGFVPWPRSESTRARRRLLHGRIAQELRLRHEDHAIIARHLELAGADADAAIEYAAAGDHARALSARAEAVAHYDRARARRTPIRLRSTSRPATSTHSAAIRRPRSPPTTPRLRTLRPTRPAGSSASSELCTSAGATGSWPRSITPGSGGPPPGPVGPSCNPTAAASPGAGAIANRARSLGFEALELAAGGRTQPAAAAQSEQHPGTARMRT